MPITLNLPEKLTTTDGQPVRPFVEVLAELNRGRVHEDLSRALHDLLGEVVRTSGKGELVFKVKVAPKGDMQVLVTTHVEVKRPKEPAREAPYFVDRHGNPTRHDPYQQQLYVPEED